MPTKNTTTSTNQYNQNSMNAFNQFTGAGQQGLLDEINNPYNNMAFNTQLQMGRKNNALSQQSAIDAFSRSAKMSGIDTNSPLYASQLAKFQRQGTANNAGLYNNLLMQGSQLRQQAIGGALSYKPLQTGQTQVQQQSGLGTWLPQVAGAAISAFTGGMAGGIGGMGGGAFGGAKPGMAANPFTANLGSAGAGYYGMGNDASMYDPGNELQGPR